MEGFTFIRLEQTTNWSTSNRIINKRFGEIMQKVLPRFSRKGEKRVDESDPVKQESTIKYSFN